MNWPVLNTYTQDRLAKIALPLGGIGTGTISLGGRGDFRDCEIMNTPAKHNRGCALFTCVQAQPVDSPSYTRLAEGPLEYFEYEGAYGSSAFNHGMPRFQFADFKAAYPFGQVSLGDGPNAPLSLKIKAFNPLVPTDADASGFPVAIIRYVAKNRTSQPLPVSICATLTNVTGQDTPSQVWTNEFKKSTSLAGLALSSEGDGNAGINSEGDMALTTTDINADITYRTAWANLSWGDSTLDFWDDFSQDGHLEQRTNPNKWPRASLCIRKTLQPYEEETFTLILSWRFPNRKSWTPPNKENPNAPENIVGNYYATCFESAWDAAEKLVERLPELEAKTIEFVSALVQTPLPTPVKEAALNNISTLRTQTSFRTEDGRFFGWEGCGDGHGSCHGSCTHVWNYEHTTAFLFGKLAQSMRTTEFLEATDDKGCMSFRVNLPIENAKDYGKAAADGQFGCIMKAYREWKLSGDNQYLEILWPKIKLAVEFFWLPGGWDGTQDGIVAGCQHNTMDVEYYGPNPQMQGWYLGALAAAEQMAIQMNEAEFAKKCRDFFQKGSEYMDQKLFNGEYYEHIIQPPTNPEAIIPELRHSMGAQDLSKPDLQLGAGCLVDQLVGQAFARVVGLPTLHDPELVKATLKSILKYNRRCGVLGHFNHLRSFVCGDETALLMASYPRGNRPTRPFPYFNEVMTGFEYTAALGMIAEGMEDEGIQVIKDIRDRYDGRKRNPFNEAECGNHYARAMAAWAAIPLLTGFQYDGIAKTMTFSNLKPGNWIWASGHAYGIIEISDQAPKLKVLNGSVSVNTLFVNGHSYNNPLD